jgi:hypothetical protein
VVAPRTGIGETLTRTYGFSGPEVDLQNRRIATS